MNNKNKMIVLLLASLILIGLFIGIGLNENNYKYVLSRRIPKIIAIVLTGAAIAFSSLLFQTITNNRILTPSILGLDSLYILIQTFIIFVFGSTNKLVLNKNLNFLVTVAFMIIFSGLLYKFLFNRNKGDLMKLLLVGIVLGTLFSSLSSFMQMMIDPNEFMHIQDNMYASFNNINTDILKISMVIFLGVSVYVSKYIKSLDVMSLGRDEAINLGVDHDLTTQKMLFIVSILISVATALVGPITFLGILVVNIARELFSTYQHKYLIPASILVSIIALVGGQFIVERIFNFSTPISVIINFIGGIYFIYLLLREGLE